MHIPAYIIDEISRERTKREMPVFEELQIELNIPPQISIVEQREDESRRGVENVEFFF